VTGTATNPITLANVPAILAAPASGDRITYDRNLVTIPD
jgi:hypothetical protein